MKQRIIDTLLFGISYADIIEVGPKLFERHLPIIKYFFIGLVIITIVLLFAVAISYIKAKINCKKENEK